MIRQLLLSFIAKLLKPISNVGQTEDVNWRVSIDRFPFVGKHIIVRIVGAGRLVVYTEPATNVVSWQGTGPVNRCHM